jgi:hypothetical protein
MLVEVAACQKRYLQGLEVVRGYQVVVALLVWSLTSAAAPDLGLQLMTWDCRS